MTTVCMWRWPVSEVKLGKGGAMLEDRGFLKKAIKNSHGWFKLAEHGEGRKPLVIIGSREQVLTFFRYNATSGIENTIPDLPDIYMGISRYAPLAQHRKITPFNDAAFATAQLAISSGAGPKMLDLGNIGSACGTVYDYVRKVLRPGIEESHKEKAPICVKFSYLHEPGMQVVGRRRMGFGAYADGTRLRALLAE